MRDQVNIYRYTTSNDGAGGVIETKTLLRENSWMDIEEVSNNVLNSSGQWIKSRSYTAKCRYREDLPLQDNDVVEWKNMLLVIKEVTLYDEDRNRFQTMTFKGGANG